MSEKYTSVRITTEVHRKIRLLALLQNKTVTDIVDDACRDLVQREGHTLKEQAAPYWVTVDK